MQLLKRDLIASLNIRAKVALNLQARSGVLLLGTPSYYLVDPYYTGPYWRYFSYAHGQTLIDKHITLTSLTLYHEK